MLDTTRASKDTSARTRALPLAPRSIALVCLLVLAPFLLIVALNLLVGPSASKETGWKIERANVAMSRAELPQDVSPSLWHTVSLHDRPEAMDSPASVWYRFDLHVTPGDELWAVYAPRPRANLAVFVNDRFVGDGGPMKAPFPVHRTPMLFTFSSGLFTTGPNAVFVRCVTETRYCNLAEIHIGPYTAVGPVYRFAELMMVTIKQVSVICLFAMSLVMTALFYMRSRDSAFGWFALGLACWATHICIMLIARAPVGAALWTNLNGIALGAFVLSAAFFVNRFIGVEQRLAERMCTLWWLFGTVVLLVDAIALGHRWPKFFNGIWIPGIILIGAYSLWQLIRANRRSPEAELRWLAFATWIVLVVGIRDGLVDSRMLQPQPLYLTYTVGVVLFVFGLIMLRRFVLALSVAERARAELELRVAEKSAELERNLVRVKDLERERAIIVERERIMRDMHDGVGGQLVQALAVAAAKPELRVIEEPLRACMEELRLIIDSLDPVDGDLGSVLGTLRARLKHRLAAAGVNIVWRVEDIPQLHDFGPHKVLQVTRIVQEAITNALKHSKADAITLSARLLNDARSILVEIADNGRGFDADAEHGHGLANMRKRASEVEGELDIETDATGTRVRLSLPI